MDEPNLSITQITGKPEFLNGKWSVSCIYKPHDIDRGWVMVFDSKDEALNLKIGTEIQ